MASSGKDFTSGPSKRGPTGKRTQAVLSVARATVRSAHWSKDRTTFMSAVNALNCANQFLIKNAVAVVLRTNSSRKFRRLVTS